MTRGTEKDFAAAHPTTAELVVEVAVSNPALDRENASLYAGAGVKEYWIVLGAEQRVEVYRQPVEGRYLERRVLERGESIETPGVPGACLPISELFR